MADFFSEIVQRLAAEKISSPRLEARALCAAVLQKNPDEISVYSDFTAKEKQEINRLLQKRREHVPLDKILKHRGFYKAEFITSEEVLSPRPDTEILVEEAAKILHNFKNGRILDLGTGSGCIIISLLCDFPYLSGTAADISAEALAVAEQNAVRLNVAERLEFMQKDWKDADFCEVIKKKFSLIVSNPPYIPSADIAFLEPEVKNHDPLIALDGGADGLDCYRQIALIAPRLLEKDGYIILEAGAGQAGSVRDIFVAAGLTAVRTVPDLAGVDRCVIMQMPHSGTLK